MEYFYSGAEHECRQIMHDYLAIKFGTSPHHHDEIVAKVMEGDTLDDNAIHYVDAVICNNTLVCIQGDESQPVENICLLNRGNGQYIFRSNLFQEKACV